jgi:hypothetical protein
VRDPFVPDWSRLPNDPQYEARASYEAALHTERSRKLYAKNERRLARARRRAEQAEHRAQQAQATPRFDERELAKMWAAVENRRDELRRIEREMQTVAASAQHRGTKSFRPVPPRS